jgi:tetratricopeptide (TPR) repeat protein
MNVNYVVPIIGTNNNGTPFHGTGFLVDSEGHVATCWHVVKDAARIEVQLPYSKPWKYQVCGALEAEDVVLLKSVVPPGSPTPFALLHPNWRNDTAPGNAVTVWGCSAAEHYTAPQRFNCTVSGFSEEHGRIGLNGDINPGDSGAPLINANEKVIGIAQLKDLKRGGQAMAIPISFLIDLLETNDIHPFRVAATQSRPSHQLPAISHQLPAISEYFTGREEDLKRVLGLVSRYRIVTLTGIGGIGKSELAKAVARAADGQEWAADGVFYLDFQAIINTTGVRSTLITSFGLDPRKDIPEQLTGNRLYVLDDLYQALLQDRHGIQDFLRGLHDRSARAHFLLTSREPVGLPGMERPCPLERILPPHDADLFRKLAEEYGYKWSDGDEQRLTALLSQLDGYPLAITICANWLDGSRLDIILKRWEQRHTAALNVPGIAEDDLDRLTSVDFSLALSYDSLPPGEPRNLFALLGDLPAGATTETLEAIMGDNAHDILLHLVRRSLVQKREDRYMMLVPVREFARRTCTETCTSLIEKLDAFLLGLAGQWCANNSVWNTTRREDAIRVLSAELPNFSAAAERAKSRADNHFLTKLTCVLCRFLALPSQEGGQLLQDGVAAARAAVDRQCEANCLRSLGDMYQLNTEYDPAQQRYEEAVLLYRSIGDKIGEASCIEGLGDVHLGLDEDKLARQRYEEAVPLYNSHGEKLGEANCLRKIAGMDETLEGYQQALTRYQTALPLFKDIGDQLGEANCLRSIAEMHWGLKDFQQARTQLEEALPLFKSVGDKPREGNCLRNLGDLHMRLEEYKQAGKRYEEAQCVFKEMGDQIGQAYCLASSGDLREMISEYLNACMSRARCQRRLGDVHLMLNNDYERAQKCYEDALPLYRDPPDVSGEAECRAILGAVRSDLKDYAGARVRYEEALKLYESQGDQLNEAECLSRLGEIHSVLEEYEPARRRFENALDLYKSNSDRLGEAKCIRGLADVHLGRKELREARQKYEEAMKLCEDIEPNDDVATIYRGMGELHMAEGKRDEAIRWLEKTAHLYESLGETEQAEEARKQGEAWREVK